MPRSEMVEQAREHYHQLSSAACHWDSRIMSALDAWGREPELLARVARLEAALREIADYLPPEDWDKGVDWQHQLALFVRAARAAMEAQP